MAARPVGPDDREQWPKLRRWLFGWRRKTGTRLADCKPWRRARRDAEHAIRGGVPVEYLAVRRPSWFDAAVHRHGDPTARPRVRTDVDFARAAIHLRGMLRTGHRARSWRSRALFRRRRKKLMP